MKNIALIIACLLIAAPASAENTGWPWFRPAPVKSVNGSQPDTTTGDIALADPLAETDNATRDRRQLSAAPELHTINNQTGTAYTFTSADIGAIVTASNTDNQTLTVPDDAALPVGSHIDVVQLGAGKVRFAAADGVTLVSLGGYTGSGGRYSGFTLVKIASAVWALFGFLGP